MAGCNLEQQDQQFFDNVIQALEKLWTRYISVARD